MSKRTAHILDQKWRSDDIKIGEDADFSSLLLPKELLRGLTSSGFKYPSPIQLKAIPVGKIGKDLLVQAKSGTGKTLVFSVVALNMLLKGAKHPQVLIMAPTREIACQICQAIKCISSAYKDVGCEYFIGGRRLEEDVPRIQGCQIIVGTPGRIKQMIGCKILKTAGIRLFVLDEADQLLKESSFTTDIDDIFRALPRDKQMIATSATYPDKLKRITDKYFRDPLLIRLNKSDIGLLGMVHYYSEIPVTNLVVVAYNKKLKLLKDILLKVNFAQCVVFCNMVTRVENLCVEVKKLGFATTYISSARDQLDRLKAIENLKKFKCRVFVSSDVSSRGIDAENIDLVINFDLPKWLDVYFHRVGRAGRYGSKCASITFITSDEVEAYQQMQQEGKFHSYPLPDCLPKTLISMQPKMKLVVKDEELSFDDETESSSDSSHNTEDSNEDGVVKQEKANGFVEDIKLNGHNELSENLANPSDEKLVDSEVGNTESRVSHGMQNQSLDINSNIRSSLKENDDLSSSSESEELDSTNSLAPAKLKEQEVGTEVSSSTEIVAVKNENDKLNVNKRIGEESLVNDKLERIVLAQENSGTLVVENIENYQSDKYCNNIHGLQQIIDTSSCLADVESICEKTIDNKLLVVNNDCNVSKNLNNPNSKELVSFATTFVEEYENRNKGSECFTADATKSSQTINVEPNDNKFSPVSLEHLRSNLCKYQYNVFKDFTNNIAEGMINEIALRCEKESVNQESDIRVQHCLKQNDGENKIKYSSLDSRNVLFSTPKTEVASGSKSDHSSGLESSSGSDKDKLIEHFNSMIATIDKIKPSSNKNLTSESSSSSESNSDTSVNSKDALYRLTKEFNKVTLEGARGYNKEANKKMGKANIINNAELSSSRSDSDSGTSIDSEKAADALEKEFTKLMKDKRSDKGSSKDTKETKKILQEIKGTKKYFKGIEIVDTKKHAESSSSTSDSDISMDINKRQEVITSIKSSKSSSNKKKTTNGLAQNKITHYCESDFDQYSKESPSGLQGGHQRKVNKRGKILRAKTVKGPVKNKITYYYSGSSSSETENDTDQYSTKSHSSPHDGHQRKKKTHKKDESLPKAKPSQFSYSNANGTSSPYLNTASERPTFDPSHPYYQMQPTNYAFNQYYQPFPQQNQSHANHGLFSGTQCSHQMGSTSYTFNPYHQPYPQQIQSCANHRLFSGTKSGHQEEPTSYASNPYYQSYPTECSLKESCQMNKMQPSGRGHSAGNFNCQRNVQSNYQLQPSQYAYNLCVVPSQHPCHPPNETCQSPVCAAWYDVFYKQWQFLNQRPNF